VIGSETQSSTLTALYGGNTKTITTGGMAEITLFIKYTVNGSSGSNRTLYLQIEGGPDASDLYLLQNFEYDSTNKVVVGYDDVREWRNSAPGVTYKETFNRPISFRSLRISLRESGSSNFGTISVRYTLSGV